MTLEEWEAQQGKPRLSFWDTEGYSVSQFKTDSLVRTVVFPSHYADPGLSRCAEIAL